MTLRPRSSLLRKGLARWLGPALFGLALLPAAAVAVRASDGDVDAPPSSYADVDPWEAKKRVLAAIPTDPAILINVTDREMPASPDILNLGKRGATALARCLADNVDAGIRSTCATLLGRLGDRAALPALQAALDDWEPEVRRAALGALREIPDKTSLEPLVKLYGRKDEPAENRARALAALGALSHPQAVAVLRGALKAPAAEGEPAFRTDAFEALWTSRHLMARETLIGDVALALASRESALVVAATGAAAELRSPRLVRPLIPLLDSSDADVRNKAVHALGLIGDKTATKALLAKLPGVRDARMLNNIAFALERLDREAFYASIRKVIEHKQAIIRLNAAFVLGDVKRPEGAGLLAKALDDPSDYVKTSAVVALGKIGTPEAVVPLRRFVDAPNLSIREEAIYALYAVDKKSADLVHDKLFQTSVYDVRRRAAIALGEAGDPRVRSFLLACLEQGACSASEVVGFVRADRDPSTASRVLLSWARGRSDLAGLIAELRPPGTVPLAVSSVDAALAAHEGYAAKGAMDLVGDLGDASAAPHLEGELQATDTWLRLHAAVALARLGDADGDTVLVRDLDNAPADWLPAFVAVMRRVAEPAARARLLPAITARAKSPSPDLAIAAAAIHLAWDPEAAIFRMLDALASPSARERDLAERYLRRDRSDRVTWLLRRALARETREDTRDRLRELLDGRGA
jgi:HEAT repeat protein